MGCIKIKDFNRTDLFFSLCGLNCRLCPMRLGGHCPGCGGGDGSQSCAIAKCSLQHDKVEYCFLCPEYPCRRYGGIEEYDSFITHQRQLKDIEKRHDLNRRLIMGDVFALIKKYWVGAILSIIFMLCLNFIFGTVCISKILIGIPCPACGMTRASLLLLSGHFKEAYEMHPLVYLIIVEVILCINYKIKIKNYSIFINISVIIVLVIFVSFYIYRMFMYYPNIEPLVYWKDNYLHQIMQTLHEYKLHK